MKNLFETGEWNQDNLRLICGDLYACMNGQQWVLLWDDADKFEQIYGCDALRISSYDETYTMYITEDRRVKVYKDYEFLRYITFDEMVDMTYSKYFNDNINKAIHNKDIAMMLNVATKVNDLCIDDIFSMPGASMLRNACVYDEILFVNVSGKKWYPIFTDIACTYDRNGDGIGVVNNIAFPSRVIIPNKKHRTLDIFRIIGDELKHVAVYDKEHIKLRANSVRESHGWKMIHYLFESELNRDVNETTLYADNKPYMTLDGDNWGEPEKEEKVEFETVSIKEHDNGFEVEIKPKEGFTSLWNKVRKNILGIKTPSERFEEAMKDFKWADKDVVNKFHKNLADALNAHVNKEFLKDKEEKPKTLNDLRKEYNFNDVKTRSLDRQPEDIDCLKSLKEIWDEYKKENDIDVDAARYSWVAHIEDGELKFDKVNSPDHYKLRGLDIEAIDVIRGALTEDEFRGFCKGNVLKYTIREGHKNGDEDLKKAKKYLEFLEKDDCDE